MKYIYTIILFILIGLISNCEFENNDNGSQKEIKSLNSKSGSADYNVGYQRYTWTDFSRAEVATTNLFDFRTVVVDIYYPTTWSEGTVSDLKDRLYKCNYLRNDVEQTLAMSLCEDPIRVTARQFAPISTDSTYPVILYNAGWTSDRNDNTRILNHLVKSGYVVVAIGSPYTDGLVYVNGKYAFTKLPGSDNYTQYMDFYMYMIEHPEEVSAFIADRCAVNVEDAAFVIQKLQSINGWLFSNKLDFGNMGYFGFSLGGWTANLALKRIPSIDAAINLDGGIHPEAANAGVYKPYMLITATALNQMNQLNVFGETIPSGLTFIIDGSAHYNYSDLCDSDVIQSYGLCGTIDPVRMSEITTAYVKAFFDKHLKEIDNPILQAPMEGYPEIISFFAK